MEKNFNNIVSSKVPTSEGFREAYLLHLADNALILGHRNSEWCGHGPVLEQDIAITNISLDLIGQARNFYQYAAILINQSTDQLINPASENTLAYLRDAHEFKNCLLVELPKGDWAQTILRQFFFSAYQFYLYQQLQNSKDEQLSAIAAKALKEVTYHLRWSSEWVIRLGDGTEESHSRILKAIDGLWNYTGELFLPANYELQASNAGLSADISVIKTKWQEKVNEIFTEATLIVPPDGQIHTGGKEGKHTEHLGLILAELQFIQRAYPGSEW
jgi:ring-1,2-phenylacetyl-CoA epoxidase subunit PaaC